MRILFSIIFSVMTVALITCAIISVKSKKAISKSVAFLLFALVPPVLGNLFIIGSPNEALSTVGCYVYFLGMNLVTFALAQFIFDYCELPFPRKLINIILGLILVADAVQLLLNLKFGHAFTMEQIEIEGSIYNRFVPLLWQNVHRIIDYSILGIIFVVVLVKAIRTPRVYAEKYWIIFVVMIAVTIWESYYIFSRTPVDRSMTGFGAFGLLVFYFSLYYRPFRLLDRMLASIASRMSESLFFFDNNKNCIWVNNQGQQLLGVDNQHLEVVTKKLNEKFGAYKKEGIEWSSTFSCGEGDDLVSFIIVSHAVIDDKERVVGSVLTIRDNTYEQKALNKETFNATHDPLTHIFNRAGYNTAIASIDMEKCMLILMDLDSFKETNDTYGHEVGDKVLINMVDTVKKFFRDEDCFCRIGGDEFAILLPNVDDDVVEVVEEKIREINYALTHVTNGLPVITVSAGGCFGRGVENTYELFKKADHALYRTKFGGKCGFTLYKKN